MTGNIIGNDNTPVISKQDLSDECKTIADRLSNLLTGVQLNAEMLAMSADESVSPKVNQLITTTKEAIQAVLRLRELGGYRIE